MFTASQLFYLLLASIDLSSQVREGQTHPEKSKRFFSKTDYRFLQPYLHLPPPPNISRLISVFIEGDPVRNFPWNSVKESLISNFVASVDVWDLRE